MKTYTKTTIKEEPRLVIRYDDQPESPREWTNLGYFITKDSRYNSPDQNDLLEDIMATTGQEAKDQKDHIKKIKKEIKAATEEKVKAIYPVVKYEHSGISYSLGQKHGFDYSNNGFYIITDKTQKDHGAKAKDFIKVINEEISAYNNYVNGEVYVYSLFNKDGELQDNCGGFYSLEDIKAMLPEEWKDEKMEDYLINNY